MEVPLLDLKAQYATIREEVGRAINEVLERQNFILGPQVGVLESEIASFCGTSHAVAVASGTDALLLSLKVLGVGAGDSVVTTDYTFFATAGTIANLGARPLFVDIDKTDFNLDVSGLGTFLERECAFKLPSKTLVHKKTGTTVKAIVPVHLFGRCADMAEILRIAGRYHLAIVEDSCQAIGARCGDARAGSIGDLGCFSFFPSKNLGGAGDGGMIVTNNEAYARQLRLLRVHGAQPKYFHAIVGFNSRLDELQAAILRVKLRHLEEWSRARHDRATRYEQEFRAAGLSNKVTLPAVVPGHTFHQYVIRCRRRDQLRAYLKERCIGTEVYYPLALHEQECFRYLGYSPAGFPKSRAAAAETLALPIYPEITAEQQACVVSAIAAFCELSDGFRP